MEHKVIRDWHIDWVLEKRFIDAFTVMQAATSSLVTGVGALSLHFSIGSSTLAQVPNTRHRAIALAATTSYIDFLWRVPNTIDKEYPIYLRHHWTTQALGASCTVTFKNLFATLSNASALTTSPTQVTPGVMAASSQSSATVVTPLTLTGRAMISSLATGPGANHVLLEDTEYLHIAINPVSTNFAIVTHNLYWLGMDIEFTPRRTFGSGNNRQARKMETNLGNSELGALNNYGL